MNSLPTASAKITGSIIFYSAAYLRISLLTTALDIGLDHKTSPQRDPSITLLSKQLQTGSHFSRLTSQCQHTSKREMARKSQLMELPLLEDDSSEEETIFTTQSSTRSLSSVESLDLSPRPIRQSVYKGPRIRNFWNILLKALGIIMSILVILMIIVIIVLMSSSPKSTFRVITPSPIAEICDNCSTKFF